MLTFGFGGGTNRLTIRNVRIAELCLYLELVEQLCADDADMRFARTADEYVARFGVLFYRHCRILFLETVEAGDDFIVFTLLLCRDGEENAGLREIYAFELDGRRLVAESVARVCELELCHGADVARLKLVDGYEVLAAHHVNRAGLFELFAVRVVGRDGVGKRTREYAHERNLSDERVGNRLHDLRGELAVRVNGDSLARLGVNGGAHGRFGGCRHIVYEVVHKRLYAYVGLCGAAAYGRKSAVENALAKARHKILLRELAVLEELFHELLIAFGGSLRERLAEL